MSEMNPVPLQLRQPTRRARRQPRRSRPLTQADRSVGRALAALREAKGVTQQRVSADLEKAGYPLASCTISRIETGRQSARNSDLDMLCSYYGTTPAELLGSPAHPTASRATGPAIAPVLTITPQPGITTVPAAAPARSPVISSAAPTDCARALLVESITVLAKATADLRAGNRIDAILETTHAVTLASSAMAALTTGGRP